MKKYITYINQYIAGYVRELVCYIIYPFLQKKKSTTKFVIFGRGRSGSTLLVSLINSHPLIFCDTEILNRKVLFPKLFINCRCKSFSRGIYGFKLLSYQLRSVQSSLDPVGFLLNLHKAGYKIIYLKRNNALRQVISKMYAAYRDRWHQTSQDKSKYIEKMTINLDQLYSQLIESENLDRFEEEALLEIPHLKLTYEDDLSDSSFHQNTIKKIADFLDVPSFYPHTDLAKITTRDFSDFIENSDLMVEFLQNTRFGHYLSEV